MTKAVYSLNVVLRNGLKVHDKTFDSTGKEILVTYPVGIYYMIEKSASFLMFNAHIPIWWSLHVCSTYHSANFVPAIDDAWRRMETF